MVMEPEKNRIPTYWIQFTREKEKKEVIDTESKPLNSSDIANYVFEQMEEVTENVDNPENIDLQEIQNTHEIEITEEKVIDEIISQLDEQSRSSSRHLQRRRGSEQSSVPLGQEKRAAGSRPAAGDGNGARRSTSA